MNRKIVSEHNKNKSEMVQPKTHIEQIECPQCKTIQNATVEHLPTFWSYVHHCEKCKYIIMESEWQKVTDKTPTEMNTEERMTEAIKSVTSYDKVNGIEHKETHIESAAKACADICKEQEKNTAVAFAEWLKTWMVIVSNEQDVLMWQDLTGKHYTTEQLFTIFTDNQNG